jgi:hypothetical protein
VTGPGTIPPPGSVSGYYDHTSILKLVEMKWNLPALTYRDANALAPRDRTDHARGELLSNGDVLRIFLGLGAVVRFYPAVGRQGASRRVGEEGADRDDLRPDVLQVQSGSPSSGPRCARFSG